jgi:hypothetical protein
MTGDCMAEVLSILDACVPRTRVPRVLTFPTHERYQSTLDRVRAEFYLWQGPGIKSWDFRFSPLPANHVLLPYSDQGPALPPGVRPDLVLSQHAIQFQAAISAAEYFSVPLLRIEHTLPEGSPTSSLGDLNVYITEHQRHLWRGADTDPIIRNAIDTDFFCPPVASVTRDQICLSVVNDWIRRDAVCGYNYWKLATAGLPTRVVGDTPGLSSAAKDTKELLSFYQSSQIFLCTATHSTSPVTVLEAMAAGCCVVAHRIAATEETITHGETGFLVDDPAQMTKMIRRLLANPQYCSQIGLASRERVIQQHSKSRFVKDWDAVLERSLWMPWWRRLWSRSD